MTTWNPPRELHDLIERSLTLDHSITTENAWKEIFEVQSLKDLLTVMNAALDLPRQVRTFVKSTLRDDQELLLTGLDKIESTMSSQSLAQRWGEVAQRLEALAVPRATLLHASAAIRHDKLEVTLEDRELEELMSDLVILIRHVESSDLPPNLRDLLVSQLQDVELAMSRIAVLGPENASANIDRVIGTLVRIEDTNDLPVGTLQEIVKWLRRGLIVVNVVRVVLGITGLGHEFGYDLPNWFEPPELP